MVFHIQVQWMFSVVDNILAQVPLVSSLFSAEVPIENGYAVHEACPKAVDPLWLEGYGHNDLPNEVRRSMCCFGVDFCLPFFFVKTLGI